MEASGTLAFYVSDRPSAIGDFAALTVTVTEIGVHRTDTGGTEETVAGENEPPSETPANATPTTTASANATVGGNETGTTNATETPADAGADPGAGDERNDPDDGGAGWITHAVDEVTVDLTELQGANATRIANVSLPMGEYNGVYVEVSNVTGTLTTGETVAVKLPSGRLRLNRGFVLRAGRSTSFVFDVAVHEAGGSGKYVLRPVIGESGTDVPIEEVPRRHTGDGRPPVDPGATTGGPPTDHGNSAAGKAARAARNASTRDGSSTVDGIAG